MHATGQKHSFISFPDPSNVSGPIWQSRSGPTVWHINTHLFLPGEPNIIFYQLEPFLWGLDSGSELMALSITLCHVSLLLLKELSICLFISYSLNQLHLGFYLHYSSETAHRKVTHGLHHSKPSDQISVPSYFCISFLLLLETNYYMLSRLKPK